MSEKDVRPRMNQAEYAEYKEWRKNHKALKEECEKVGIPQDQVSSYWYKGKHFSIRTKHEDNFDPIKAIDEFAKLAKKKIPSKPKVRNTAKGGKVLVIDPADVHVGKLCVASETGEEYNIDIAIKNIRDGVCEILRKAVRLHGKEAFDCIFFVLGNDILHVDNAKGETTGGTKQDADGLFHQAYTRAFSAIIDAIRLCAEVANVHCPYCPSNHDAVTGFCLAHGVEVAFRNDKRVTFDCSKRDRKYACYGKTLLAFTHADGAKNQDLHSLAMSEARGIWGDATRVKWFCHHLHHKQKIEYLDKKQVLTEKDYGGTSIVSSGVAIIPDCGIEYVRSCAGTDGWHHKNGYQHAPKMIEAWVFDKEKGEEDKIVYAL